MNLHDKKDLRILEELNEHGNWSFKKISYRTGIPTTTIHNRVKKMEKNGVIRKYTVDIDHSKIGRGMLAHILVRVNFNKWRDLANFLKKELKGNTVQEFSRVTGNYDAIIKIRFSDMKELEKFYNRIEETQTVHQTITLLSIAENF